MLLTVTADAPVEQYEIQLHDDDAQMLAYSSVFIPVSTPGKPLDLTKNELKLALKLSRGGHFTLMLVGAIGEVDNGKLAASATQLFWAGKLQVDGPVNVKARLLTVPPGDDSDGDFFPDAQPFMQHVPAAAQLYAGKTNVLDCDDKINNPPAADGTPIALTAHDINPFATEICGIGYDVNCDNTQDDACVDKDHDHDVHGHDCDDSDPKRHHPTDIDPFPDPPNCCGYSLGKLNTPDEHTDFLHAAGDPACFAGTCARDMTLCPMKRCGDGIDEACRGVANDPKNDTTCIVDEDCDGYPAMVNGQVFDCDDHDPNTHPGALEPCGSTKDLNCDGAIGEGCVPCDLDGDGFERSDPANNCPDGMDKHPGIVDCDDDDAGVFPGATSVAGGSEGGVSVGKVAAALRGFCRGIYEAKALTGTAKINPFGGLVGDADCNGKAYEGCPALIDPACDQDGDGWPGVAMVGPKNCNPNNVQLDCDDTDPTTFPSAPVNCKSNRPTYKENCTPQGTPDCSGDMDGDGYAAPADCDDKDPTVHPFAVEICDGKDNDCDGLVDEGNPDPSGKPLVTAGAITTCTDSNTGECAKTKGSCVCSIAQPVKDPLLAQLGQPRTMCPGETAGGKAPSCFGAGQPKPQSCDATNPKDDDCDGRVDAPDGARLAVKGMTCGINVGQCKAGIVVACNKAQTNCFTAFGRTPATTAWWVCSSMAPDPVTICPVAEMCNGLDDDCDGTLAGGVNAPTPGQPTNDERDHDADHYIACSGCSATLAPGLMGCNDCNDTNPNIHPNAPEICNGIDDACAGPGFMDGKDDCGKGGNATKPTCCGGSGCKDTTSDFTFCGSCTPNTCSATSADRCYMSSCSCGTTGVPCGAGLTCQAGACVAGNGATCSTDGQCQSGHCTDGHCCTVATCGTCKACTGMGGSCVNQPAGMPGNGCSGAGQVCDGAGNCKKDIGQMCASGAECFNNQCVDGYCCNAPCGGQCQACNLTGKLGMCSPVTGAPVTPRPACTAIVPMCGGSCDGTNTSTCTYPGSATTCPTVCVAGSGNTPAHLQPQACDGAGNCGNSGAGMACTTDPGTIKCNAGFTDCLANCAADTDCISSDYCSSTGGGTCQPRHGSGSACTTTDCLVGGCNYCAAADPCRASGQCCAQACAAPSCSGTMHTQTINTCNGSGVCQAATTSCMGYVCDGTTHLCKTTCAGDTDCYTGFYCNAAGHCTMELSTGTMCNPATDCYMMSNCHECQGDMTCGGNGKC